MDNTVLPDPLSLRERVRVRGSADGQPNAASPHPDPLPVLPERQAGEGENGALRIARKLHQPRQQPSRRAAVDRFGRLPHAEGQLAGPADRPEGGRRVQ